MEIHVCWALLFVCLIATDCNAGPLKNEKTHFRAASYEHYPVPRPDGSDAKYILAQNLQAFKDQTEVASVQGADIIVFPEYGAFGVGFSTRDSIYPFLEEIPDPDEAVWNPCLDAENTTDILAQFALSCMAMENEMYVVANVGDKISCSPEDDPNCPEDGRYQYNTNVVFNPEGVLVSRYHKQTLFYEEWFDTPFQIEHSTFDTPFGKFGTFVCFDVLFEQPAIGLVEDYLVDHVAYPTAWISKMPLMQGIAYHESWSIRHGVSFLQSELHYPEEGFAGSTLVAAADGSMEFYFNDTVGSEPKLLIADLPIEPAKPISKAIGELPEESENLDLFTGILQKDLYTFVTLDDEEGNVTLYTGSVKCNVAYRFSDRCEDDLYAVGVFDGLHDSAHDSYIQVCTLIRCEDASDRSTCGESTVDACSEFEYIELVSETSTDYIYPQVVFEDGFVGKSQWSFAMDSEGNHRATMRVTPTSPVVTAALYGRDHSRDQARKQPKSVVNDGSSGGISTNMNVFLIIAMSLLVSGLLFAANRVPGKRGIDLNQSPNYGAI